MGKKEKKETQKIASRIENKWYDEWIEQNIEDLTGKVAIITGANSGTGFWASNALAGKGCHVVLACRNEEKAKVAKDEIIKRFSQAKLTFIPLDNNSFQSVRAFAKVFHEKFDRLDMILNNAGIMNQPWSITKDGYDVQLQTNHLSHFLLTKLLWNKIVNTPGQSRVVQHASLAHKMGKLKFDADRLKNPSYSAGLMGSNFLFMNTIGLLLSSAAKRYGVSKLANVLFMRDLQRKISIKKLEHKIISIACHPGWADTNLPNTSTSWLSKYLRNNPQKGQSAADGSLPLLMAAVGKRVENGDYLGPENGMTGAPKKDKIGGNGNDAKMAKTLWNFSEKAVKEKFDI
jgi:NAD(P)-dependent dehydrogenase (short-subunit alcohol dehydrogenase family)